MRTMKDSGIAWIGEIPEEWEATMLKNHVVCLDGQRIPVDAAQRSPGVYPYWGAGNIVDHVDNFLFDEELVLLGEDGAPFFDPYRPVAFYSNEKIWVNNHIHVLRAKSINAKYLVYSLNSIDYSLYINGSILSKLTQSNMNKIFLCYPPLPEQHRIADYLDTKCAEIDHSMELVRQGIDKLKEYKKSVITEAVTKGLDPDVPMKDSGVPWIGEIPKGWSIQRLKNIATVARGGSPRPIEDYLTDDENGINWIKIGDTIKGNKFIDKVQQKIRIDGLSKTRRVHKGDLILTNSMSFGEPYILNIDGAIHDGWVCLQDIKINIMFLYYILCSQLCLEQFKLLTSGGVVQNLNIEKIGSVTIFLPSLQEQECIVNYLDAKCAEIDTLIAQKQALLDKLAEYKKSLIFECVTGKREVAA